MCFVIPCVSPCLFMLSCACCVYVIRPCVFCYCPETPPSAASRSLSLSPVPYHHPECLPHLFTCVLPLFLLLYKLSLSVVPCRIVLFVPCEKPCQFLRSVYLICYLDFWFLKPLCFFPFFGILFLPFWILVFAIFWKNKIVFFAFGLRLSPYLEKA